MSGGTLISVVAAIIGLGVLAQLVADRVRMPSVLFLMFIGIAVGPEGINLVTRDVLTNALRPLIGLSIAIIIFKEAFTLRTGHLRQMPSETGRLVTIGAVFTLVGTATVVHFAIQTSWVLSFLIGSLLTATGATVVPSVLHIVNVRERVTMALETESVVNDITAAVLAIALFETVLLQQAEPITFLEAVVTRLGAGVMVGLAVGALLWYLLTQVEIAPRNDPQNTRLLVLTGAIVAHGAGEAFASEAGILAAAIAGFVLGNVHVPYEETVIEFEDDVTMLVLSFVFIPLAAFIRFRGLLGLGVGGVLVAVAVIVVIRPIAVFLSTSGDWFTREEKLFMSFVAPRGIVPASVATLFAIEIRHTEPAAANALAGTVFLVILLSIVVEGGFARHIAASLDVEPERIIVVGGGPLGRTLAERYRAQDKHVRIVEADRPDIEAARDKGFTAYVGDPTDPAVLEAAGVPGATRVVAVVDDETNLEVARLADEFGVTSIVVEVDNPENVDTAEDIGAHVLKGSQFDIWALENHAAGSSLPGWLTTLRREGIVQETRVTADEFVGATLGEFQEQSPRRNFVTVVDRNGTRHLPNEEFVFEKDDELILVGEPVAVKAACERLHETESSA